MILLLSQVSWVGILGTTLDYLAQLGPPAISGDSRNKKVGGQCGAKEKVGGNVNVYLSRWFFIVLKIKLLWLTLSNPTLACEYR